VQAAGRNFAADYDLGPAEKISLEIHEAHVAGLMKLVGCLELSGQHLALRGPKPAHHAGPLLWPGCPEVDFYDVGKLAKRYARIVGCEVVEGDEIASRFQPFAGGDDAVFGLNGFENLGHGLAGRQQRNQVFEQDLASAIHEGALVVAKRLDTVKQGAIQGGAGRKFRIGVEVVFDTVSEKNLVPEYILSAVKNGLAGDKALSRQGERERCRHFLFGRNGFHFSYIGVAVAELQVELRECHSRKLGCAKDGAKRARESRNEGWEVLAHFGNAQMWKTKGIPPLRSRPFHE